MNIYDEAFFTSVKPNLKNVLNSIQLPLRFQFLHNSPFREKAYNSENFGRSYSLFEILWSKHFSRMTVIYLIAKVKIMKLSHEIIKLKHENILCQREKRSKIFQVKARSKVVRKTTVPSFMSLFNLPKSVVFCVKKMKIWYNFHYWTNEITNKYTIFS